MPGVVRTDYYCAIRDPVIGKLLVAMSCYRPGVIVAGMRSNDTKDFPGPLTIHPGNYSRPELMLVAPFDLLY